MKKLTFLIAFLPLLSCMQNDHANENESKERTKAALNEQRVTNFYKKVINEHNPAMIDSFCSADYFDHMPFPGYPPTIEGLKKGFTEMMTGFPDMLVTVKMIKSFGDTVVSLVRMQGTNRGMFMGAPATDKAFDIEGVDIIILEDGKATEHWGFSEEMKMMTQLGMGQPMPEPQANKE